MAKPSGEGDVGALVEASFGARSSRICWAQRLSGEAREYLDALRATGETPVYARVSSILREHFATRVSDSSVRNHFRGDCRCPENQ